MIAERHREPRWGARTGAASMGPRSDDRGKASIACRRSTRSGLQWGRDQMIAESRSTETRTVCDIPLQWGRDQMIAESLIRPVFLDQTTPRFNGAAIR